MPASRKIKPTPSGDLDRTPVVGASAVQFQRQSRFNPLLNLSPQYLTRLMDGFKMGDLAQCSLLWQAMADRDDVWKGVRRKREQDVARRDWDVIRIDDSADAKRQQELLEGFWHRLSAVDAFDRNRSGGVRALITSLMSAQTLFYSAHHIVWQPRGGDLSAQLEFVPLNFFENRTGMLRGTLPDGLRYNGDELDMSNWIVSAGDGLAEPCSVAYMFKHLALNDWLGWCEKFGIPFVYAVAPQNCTPKQEAWNELVKTVGGIMTDNAGVFSHDTKLETLSLTNTGEMAFPALIERSDRAITSLYRGADLSSMSRSGGGTGASLQAREGLIITADDCEWVTEQLQKLERLYLAWHGIAQPLAGIRVRCPVLSDTTGDLAIDQFLVNSGVKLATADLAERYERKQAADGEATAQPPNTHKQD